jgi:hypothetical protein
MEARKKWAKQEAGTEKQEVRMPFDWEAFRIVVFQRARVAAGVLFTVFCFTIAGIVEWAVFEWMHQPKYTVIKAHFQREGRPQDGQRVAEMGSVCSDDAKTPLACSALYNSSTKISAFVASSQP